MMDQTFKVALVMGGILLFHGCAKVPITGRSQMNLVGESQLMVMAATEYTSFLSENPPMPASDARVKQVRTVGDKLATAAAQYLADNRASDRIEGFTWEFNVVNDNSVNAWCMPGGKVVVYTGILPVTQNDAGLAVVMGHEIAHAIARHGNERMSQGIALQGAGQNSQVHDRLFTHFCNRFLPQCIGHAVVQAQLNAIVVDQTFVVLHGWRSFAFTQVIHDLIGQTCFSGNCFVRPPLILGI